ncbi:MAG: radical SAM family heme chaperone HemW [Actinobacteria bacterium]|nr:radical SAM family heme chaperone HemW [Actinomycetota bacterium]
MRTDPLRPDDPVLADRAAGWRGAYVHIPFCRRVCPYCDFAVVAGRDDLRDRYVEAVVAEIAMAEPFGPLQAVAFGGGTPSRLGASGLGRILEALANRFGLVGGSEVSLEANPEDWTPALAGGLVAAGFTRLSLGAQSFDPVVLGDLGRLHRPADIGRAVGEARRAGFGRINLDLILGSPAESDASWDRTLAAALDCGVDHLSTYALTVERGTALSRAIRAGAPGPDPDVQADRYERALAAAAGAGLVRYETSNHAVPGAACAYNLLTWGGGEYEAFGTAAHGHRDGVRYWNVRRIDRYLERVEAGRRPESGREVIVGADRERERLVLGLRRAAGVIAGSGGRALLASPDGRRLVEAGVLAERGDRLVVARPLLGDEVARAVLALPLPDC